MATFVFSAMPTRGARTKVVWLYNNRKVGEVTKALGKQVSSSVRGSRGLPKGFWRAQLLVRLGRGSFRPVAEARTRVC
jgi:hypothetical protein